MVLEDLICVLNSTERHLQSHKNHTSFHYYSLYAWFYKLFRIFVF